MTILKRSAAGWFAPASSLLVPAAAFAESAAAEPKPSKTYWVYIGTYTGNNSDSKGIYRFDLDAATGKLSNKTLAAESASPSYLAVAPERQVPLLGQRGPQPEDRRNQRLRPRSQDRRPEVPQPGVVGRLRPVSPNRR